jgi:hypothetical protein
MHHIFTCEERWLLSPSHSRPNSLSRCRGMFRFSLILGRSARHCVSPASSMKPTTSYLTSVIYLARLWLNQCGAGLAHNRANANLWKGLTDLGADVEEMPRSCSKSSQCGHCPHGCPCMHLASLSQRHSPSNFCVGTGSRCPPCYMIFMPVFLLLPSPALLRLKSWSQLYLGSYWMFC